jgi:threonine dehydrogenase-like Zn-dependent dehydrogenase
VKPGGYVMMVGASFDPAPVRPSAWVTRRVTVRAAFAYSRGDYAATIDLLANGGIDVGPVMSDVVPASATAEAFERLLQPNSEIKILVDPRA